MFYAPLAAFLGLAVMNLVSEAAFVAFTDALYNWILASFSSLIAIVAFALVALCLVAALSPLGKVRIGGSKAVPIITRWNWFAITLSTTLAIGILFWGAAEPIYHLYDTGNLAHAPGSDEAVRFAQVSLFMHWGFTPYAIYAAAGLAFAIAHHNYGKAFSIVSPLEVLIGRQVPRRLAEVIDAIGLLALLFGLATSLGTGILSISGGINRLLPVESSSWLYGVIALVIVAAFFASSASGLHRGIRALSDINVKIFAAIALFVLVAGPTLEIVTSTGSTMLAYGSEFVERSLVIGAFDDREWANSWTVFYLANWFAWAPLAAMFLGRIAVGYQVREFILVNFVIAALCSIGWMAIFGGLSISIESANPGLLKGVLDAQGPEAVLYRILDFLPFPIIVASIVIVTVSFLSFVTAADSNLDAISRLCHDGHSDYQDASKKTDTPSARSTIWVKLLWACLVGFIAWLMISTSGVDGIRMLSNLGGFPSLFIVLFFAACLIKFVRDALSKAGRERLDKGHTVTENSSA